MRPRLLLGEELVKLSYNRNSDADPATARRAVRAPAPHTPRAISRPAPPRTVPWACEILRRVSAPSIITMARNRHHNPSRRRTVPTCVQSSRANIERPQRKLHRFCHGARPTSVYQHYISIESLPAPCPGPLFRRGAPQKPAPGIAHRWNLFGLHCNCQPFDEGRLAAAGWQARGPAEVLQVCDGEPIEVSRFLVLRGG